MNGHLMRPKAIALLLAGAGVALLVLANAHLVYVSVKSQPDCVPHLKAESANPGAYRAARSAC